MSLKKYRALLEAVESGSLTRAAEKLHYTQPGISHMILSLEEEFGFPLLVRGKNGVSPTAEAEKLLVYLRQIVNGEEKLQETVQRIHGLDVGTIRIGCFYSLSIHLLPSVVAEFTDTYPGIELQLYVGEHGELTRWLHEGQIDLAFMSLPVPEDVRFLPLFDDPIYAVLPADHPLAKQEYVRPAELVRYPFIMQYSGSDEDVNRVLMGEKLQANVRFRVRGDEAIQSMVAKNLGVTLAPELVLYRMPEGLALRPLQPEYHRTLGIAFPPGGGTAPAMKRLVRFVQRYCERTLTQKI
ncbi:MAG: LysR family transcriptional regulator [Oscillospiraceae bacterium]